MHLWLLQTTLLLSKQGMHAGNTVKKGNYSVTDCSAGCHHAISRTAVAAVNARRAATARQYIVMALSDKCRNSRPCCWQQWSVAVTHKCL